MNNIDVAGLLMTYSEKTRKARNKEHFQDLIRELKRELNSKVIKDFTMSIK